MNAPETRISSPPKSAVKQGSQPPEELLPEIGEERRGMRGAVVIAAIAVSMLFLGWLLFYFDLYLRRGGG
jgi:hypothetical protein